VGSCPAYRVRCAGLVALAYGPAHGYGSVGYSLANHFGYFTIQSNILGEIELLVGALLDPIDRRWPHVRGASRDARR
jgi:hypothetical protein